MPIIRPQNAPKFSWENLKVNDDLGHVTGRVDEGAVLAHAFSIGENPELFIDGLPGIGPFVPPSLLVNDLLKLFLVGYDCTEWGAGGGLHTKSVIKYHAPLPIGAEVTIAGSHIAKYVRGGRCHRSVSSNVRSGSKLIAEMLATETVGYTTDNGPDSGAIPPNWSDGFAKVEGKFDPSAPRALSGAAVEPGMVIGPVTRWAGLEQSVMFSGYPFAWAQEKPFMRQGLHTNFEVAERAGYPVPVVQGLLSAGHLSTLLLKQFGAKVFDGAELALKFVAPTLAGTKLTSHAVVQKDSLEDSWLMSLATVAQDDSLKTVGYAKVPK
jgi:hypothetical protein